MQGRQFALTVVFLVAEAMFAGTAWSAQAGRVQFVNGDVQVTDAAGKVHAMQKGQPINEGDTVTSAQNASAQIKMLDGGFVAIRPDTRLKFDSFKFSNKEGEPENSFFSLFKGGFRAITGLIGRIRHEEYKITTPVATIGIRGTDHETVVVPPDDPLVTAGQAAPGTYNKVNTGETSITTDVGTINVLPNQMGFAGGLNQMPQIQPINTNLFTVTPPPSPGAGDGGQGERDTAVVDPVAQTPGGNDQVPAGLPNTAPPSVVIDPTLTVVPQLPAQGIGGVAYFQPLCDCFAPSPVSGVAQYTTNAAGGMNSFSATDPVYGSFMGNLGTAALVDTGGNLLAGNLNWGRWAGAGATVAFGASTPLPINGGLVYIGGDIPTMPVSGTANYVPVGGTTPVDVNGNTGTFLGASLTANFTTALLTVNYLNIGFGGNIFSLSGSVMFDPNGIIPTFSMTGTCSGPTCSSVASYGTYGYAAGAFTGPNAAGLGLAYQLYSSGMSGSVSIIGAEGFIKQ